jgi:exodeoxyribonuclease VII small subunit
VSFEASLQRLQEIVDALETQELPLARSLELFEEAITHLREATVELARAEATVKVLRERADGVLETLQHDA